MILLPSGATITAPTIGLGLAPSRPFCANWMQRRIVGAHRGKRIDLGMALAAACMIAFADDSSVARAERRLLWGCCYALPSLGEGLWVGG